MKTISFALNMAISILIGLLIAVQAHGADWPTYAPGGGGLTAAQWGAAYDTPGASHQQAVGYAAAVVQRLSLSGEGFCAVGNKDGNAWAALIRGDLDDRTLHVRTDQPAFIWMEAALQNDWPCTGKIR